MLLYKLPLNTPAVINNITGPKHMKEKLSALNINVGTKLEICNKVKAGVIIKIYGSRIAICNQIVHHIHILKENSNEQHRDESNY